MKVSLRKFTQNDIENKIRWVNNPENNSFLHYDLPLEYDKTNCWFEKKHGRTDRYDAVIEVDKIPVGLIGLLSIDERNQKAEYYIMLGEAAYKGRGIAREASQLLLDYAFRIRGLRKIYLYTETKNVAAQRLFERIGFRKEGFLKNDLFCRGNFVDRFIYGITAKEYEKQKEKNPARPTWQVLSVLLGEALWHKERSTPIQPLGNMGGNSLYMKREDLFPYSFGGNKARKGMLFFREVTAGGYDCIVTYGGSHSNHCRVIANMAAGRKLPCYIIAPKEVSDTTFNRTLVTSFGAENITVLAERVHSTIEEKLLELRTKGRKPYFIPGGGHGNIGTQAYVDCYREIQDYENESGIHFDYIFLASGTGTTQAGLICGQLLSGEERKVIGISIARQNPYGRDVILGSIHDYLSALEWYAAEEVIQERTILMDDYVGGGYGKENAVVADTIKEVMLRHGIPLDGTYTGKAFWGMEEYLKREGVFDKNILFIHTGGTPLFFDGIRKWWSF